MKEKISYDENTDAIFSDLNTRSASGNIHIFENFFATLKLISKLDKRGYNVLCTIRRSRIKDAVTKKIREKTISVDERGA